MGVGKPAHLSSLVMLKHCHMFNFMACYGETPIGVLYVLTKLAELLEASQNRITV